MRSRTAFGPALLVAVIASPSEFLPALLAGATVVAVLICICIVYSQLA